jgi:energy-coupling factor transporter ATP-binding protein EcfA2
VVTLRFPPELPISARVEDLTRAIEQHPVVIVAGATGSGKTTQLPKIALAMGRAASVAHRGHAAPAHRRHQRGRARGQRAGHAARGQDVGYQVRFDDRTGKNTAIKFMTDGILLAEIQGDRRLRRYDTLIIDEAHERSLTIDFLLGWIARILPRAPRPQGHHQLRHHRDRALLGVLRRRAGGAGRGPHVPGRRAVRAARRGRRPRRAVARAVSDGDLARPARRRAGVPPGRARDPRVRGRAAAPDLRHTASSRSTGAWPPPIRARSSRPSTSGAWCWPPTSPRPR